MPKILYLVLGIATASIVGFVVGVRATSKHKDKVFTRVNDFVLSAEVSTKLDGDTLLGEALLKNDLASQEAAAKIVASQLQLGAQRILEDRQGVGQLTNQEKIDRALRTKDALLAKASAFAKEIQEAEQGGTGQPATRSQSKSEGSDKPQPEAEGRSR
jgi:hypothetical protein